MSSSPTSTASSTRSWQTARQFSPANGLAVCQERVDEAVLVGEEDIKEAFRFLYGRAKVACEAAGAATTAALMSGKVKLEPGETAVAVISGGNVALETASAILAGA